MRNDFALWVQGKVKSCNIVSRFRLVCMRNPMTHFIFVTGGVVSSLGKGISAASVAALLEARGLKVTMVKMDPYINVDPGTMSPFQHGEVFVTEDGALLTYENTLVKAKGYSLVCLVQMYQALGGGW